MKIAIEGCAHGELDAIYSTLSYIERTHSIKIDLLICCGDFQSIRNDKDLRSLAVPEKYMDAKDFSSYYSGEKTAPILTIFIGGNHEGSTYLQELFYGGWVAPNIYYLGCAGVVNFGGLRLAGLSGIYKSYSYQKGHHEKPPYNENDKRSVYHVREQEILRLLQISNPIDIFISHDWPQGILNYGNKQQLFNRKPFLRQEEHSLGNPACTTLLNSLQPTYWFAAHMHVKFAAIIPHSNSQKQTNFLALSKVTPNNDFLQVLDIPDPPNSPSKVLQMDPEWLAILVLTQHLMHNSPTPISIQGEVIKPTQEQINKVAEILGTNNLIISPDSFEKYDGEDVQKNPQSLKFLQILNKLEEIKLLKSQTLNLTNPDEILLDDIE